MSSENIDSLENEIMSFFSHEHKIGKTDWMSNSFIEGRHKFCELAFPNREIKVNSVWGGLRPTLQSDNMMDIFLFFIEKFGRKITFGGLNKENLKNSYIFPSPKTLASHKKYFSETTEMQYQSVIINNTESDVENFVLKINNSIKNDINGNDNRVSFIIGNVGCGKSTFTKYMTNYHHDIYHSTGVCPVRIEYSKIRPSIMKTRNFDDATTAFSSFIKSQIVRNIFRYSLPTLNSTLSKDIVDGGTDVNKYPNYNPVWNFLNMENSKNYTNMTNAINTWYALHHKIIDKSHIDAMSKNIKLAWDSRIGDKPPSFRFNDAVNDTIILLAYSYGIRFQVIFDGFDLLEADELREAGDKFNVHKCLSNFLWDELAKISVHGKEAAAALPVHAIAVMRESTYAILCSSPKYMYRSALNTEVYKIICPSAQDLLKISIVGLISNLKNEHLLGLESQKKIILYARKIGQIVFDEVVRTLIKRSSLHFDYEFDCPTRRYSGEIYYRLFNENARQHLGFVRELIKFLFRDTVRDYQKSGKQLNQVEIMKAIADSAEQKFKKKAYKIIHILLTHTRDDFENFQTANLNLSNSDVNFEFKTEFQENNLESGFIDNIYNYHHHYIRLHDQKTFYGDYIGQFDKVIAMRYVLENTLDKSKPGRGVLSSSKYVTYNQILSRFVELNLCTYETRGRLDLCLSMLVRAGFLGCCFQSNNLNSNMCYYLMPIGAFLMGGIYTSLPYVEHIFHRTLIPTFFHPYLSTYSRRGDATFWAAGAIVNCFIFLTWVTEIERYINNVNPKYTPFISNEMRLSLYNHVSNMIEADRKRRLASKSTDITMLKISHTMLQNFKKDFSIRQI